MKRKQAIKTIIGALGNKEALITSTGLMSRELFCIKDSPCNFYMTGSMGLASSLGLGVAINKPNRKIVVVEGDASLLMNFGTLATIGHFRPNNLIHVILDNNSYASCSEEPSISNTARIDKVAEVVGYNIVERVCCEKELKNVLEDSLNQSGPILILVDIELGGRRNLARPLKLDKISERFRKFLLK